MSYMLSVSVFMTGYHQAFFAWAFWDFLFLKYLTRQLPMGAGHCQWGGYTDGNVCNIHEEEQTENEAPRSNGLGATGVH